MERQVTIFGGTGFVGRHLVRSLARRGWRVVVAARDVDAAQFLKPMGQLGQIVPLFCDYRQDESLAAAMRGSEAIVNLVGILYERGAQRFKRLHTELPERLARLASVQGVQRMAHISAIGASLDSAALYARSKAAGELAVQRNFPRAIILRPSVIFGPEDDFLNRFGAMAKCFPVLPLIGGGHTRFQPVYVGDVAAAIAESLNRPEGAVYELGGPRIYSFKELLVYVMQETRRHRLLVNLPWSLAKLEAQFLQWLPNPPLTPDQVELLKTDNVVGPDILTLADLGVSSTAMELIAPTYLSRFRPSGK